MTHTNGRSEATSASNVSTPSATMNRSAGPPWSRPKVLCNASALRVGQSLQAVWTRSQQPVETRIAQLDLGLGGRTSSRPGGPARAAATAAWSSSAVLPTPISPRTTNAPLKPLVARSRSPSSTPRSASRPTSCVARPRPGKVPTIGSRGQHLPRSGMASRSSMVSTAAPTSEPRCPRHVETFRAVMDSCRTFAPVRPGVCAVSGHLQVWLAGRSPFRLASMPEGMPGGCPGTSASLPLVLEPPPSAGRETSLLPAHRARTTEMW